MKAVTSRTKKTTQAKPTVLRLIPQPHAPHPHCQDVADGLAELKLEALHGRHVGALIMVVHPDGTSTWDAYGTLGEKDDKTMWAATNLTTSVYNSCWKRASE
jgi:hypothetical protein